MGERDPRYWTLVSLALPESNKHKHLVGENSLLRYFKPCIFCTNLHDIGMLNYKVESETRTCTVEEIMLWKQFHAA